MSEKFADVGAVVTCENGHEICDVSAPLVPGDIIRAEQFKNFRDGSEPKYGDKIEPCPVCGGEYIKNLGKLGGHKVHVYGKWVP